MNFSLQFCFLESCARCRRVNRIARLRRQAQGIATARTNGRYKGRSEDAQRNAAIVNMLANGQSWASIVAATGASRSMLSKLTKRVPQSA